MKANGAEMMTGFARGASPGGWMPGSRLRFWRFAVVSCVVLVAAWMWFGSVHEEEMTEQAKAISAGTSMAGFATMFGTVPLVLVHVLTLGTLGTVGVRGRPERWSGAGLAAIVVALASCVGILLAQLMWAGNLFRMGVAGAI